MNRMRVLLRSEEDIQRFFDEKRGILLAAMDIKRKELKVVHPDTCKRPHKVVLDLLREQGVRVDPAAQAALCKPIWELWKLLTDHKYIATDQDIENFLSMYEDEIAAFPQEEGCRSLDGLLEKLGAVTTIRDRLCAALNNRAVKRTPAEAQQLVVFEKIAAGNYAATDLVAKSAAHVVRDLLTTKISANTFVVPLQALFRSTETQKRQPELPAGFLALSHVGAPGHKALLLSDPATPIGPSNPPNVEKLKIANAFAPAVLPKLSAWAALYGPAVLQKTASALALVAGAITGAVLQAAKLGDAIYRRVAAWNTWRKAEAEQKRLAKEAEREERRKRGIPETDTHQTEQAYPEWSRRVMMSFAQKEAGLGLYNWAKKAMDMDKDTDLETERIPENSVQLKSHQRAAIRAHFPQSGPQHQLLYMGAGSGKTYILCTIALLRRPEFLEESKALYRMLRQEPVYLTNEPRFPDHVVLATSTKKLVEDYYHTFFIQPLEEIPFELRHLFRKLRTLCSSSTSSSSVEAAIISRLKRINIVVAKYTSLLTKLSDARISLSKGNLCVILDECQTIKNMGLTQSNASYGVHAQKRFKREFTEPLFQGKLKFWGCVGATATPFLETWQDTIELYNAIVAGTKFTVDLNALTQLVETRPFHPDDVVAFKRCLPSQAELARYSHQHRFKASVSPSDLNRLLFAKFRSTVLYYDPTTDTESFATIVHNRQQVETENGTYIHNSLYGASKKPRVRLASTRVVTTPRFAHIPGSTEWSATPATSLETLVIAWRQEAHRGVARLSDISPLVEQCVKILAKREGKTVIFAANPDGYGINVVHKMLKAIAHKTFLDPKVKLEDGVMVLNEETDNKQVKWEGVPVTGRYDKSKPCTRDGKRMESILSECRGDKPRIVSQTEANKLRFRCDSGTGQSSLVLCLGSKHRQGTSLTGAPGIPPPDAMIILGEIEDSASATQLWSRIVRLCGSYDWPKRSVTIYQLSLRYRGERSCDDRLEVLRQQADRVTPVILQSMRSASVTCPAFRSTHGVSCDGLTAADLAVYETRY